MKLFPPTFISAGATVTSPASQVAEVGRLDQQKLGLGSQRSQPVSPHYHSVKGLGSDRLTGC